LSRQAVRGDADQQTWLFKACPLPMGVLQRMVGLERGMCGRPDWSRIRAVKNGAGNCKASYRASGGEPCGDTEKGKKKREAHKPLIQGEKGP